MRMGVTISRVRQHGEIVYHVVGERGVTACRQSILSMSGVVQN